ncbi:MAG: hypothetical protein MHM6MM_007030 [Cercozoa sp. M6MM]
MGNKCFVVGDIGGTNCRLQLLRLSAVDDDQLLAERIYAAHEQEGLCEVVQQFLCDVDAVNKVSAVCLAIAGPVQHNCVNRILC